MIYKAIVFLPAFGALIAGLLGRVLGARACEVVTTSFVGIGAVLFAVFLAIEARAKEPIVPLDLWRNRTYAGSIVSTFLISFGFFGAIIFLPQWFQFVRGVSATESGFQSLALLAGLIVGSIGSGQLVARRGHTKLVVLAGLATMSVGLLLMTNLRSDTSLPVLWLWMFITGLGIGPTFSVFTIVVQNAVPFAKLGVATSNLTFFRQIGGSVGLAIAGTQFGSALRDELPSQTDPVFTSMAGQAPEAARPAIGQFHAMFNQLIQSGQGIDLNNQTGVGQSFGNVILQQVPAAFQSVVQPFVVQFDRVLVRQRPRGAHQAGAARAGRGG